MTENDTLDLLPDADEGDGASDDDPQPSPAGVVLLHEAWSGLPGAFDCVHRAVNATVSLVPALARGEIAIALSSDAAIRALNARFRGQDKPTNVLSFPSGPGPETTGPSGDIVIAYETLMREAAADGIAPLHHLAHLTVHGLLHLAGYDHDSDHDAGIMEALERRILATIAIDDPYRSFMEEDQPREPVETRI